MPQNLDKDIEYLTFLNYDTSQPRYMYIEHIPFLLVTGSLENDFFF